MDNVYNIHNADNVGIIFAGNVNNVYNEIKTFSIVRNSIIDLPF